MPICLYAYIIIYVYMYTYVFLCVRARAYACMYVCMYIYIYLRVSTSAVGMEACRKAARSSKRCAYTKSSPTCIPSGNPPTLSCAALIRSRFVGAPLSIAAFHLGATCDSSSGVSVSLSHRAIRLRRPNRRRLLASSRCSVALSSGRCSSYTTSSASRNVKSLPPLAATP